MSAGKAVNILVATTSCWYLLHALLTAAMPCKLVLLAYCALTSRERSMASLGSVRSFVLLRKSFVFFMYDAILNSPGYFHFKDEEGWLWQFFLKLYTQTHNWYENVKKYIQQE